MNIRFKHLSVATLLAVACMGGQAMAQVVEYRPGVDTTRFTNVRTLPFEELERIAAREIPHLTKIEIKDMTLKAKGYDAQGLKVDVLIDRRDGFVLSHRVKYPKHMRHAYPAGTAPTVIHR